MMTEKELLRLIEGLEAGELEAWVEEGWVRPARERRGYVFHEVDVARVRLIHEMRARMEVDAEAVALILSLMDQLYGLRRELRRLAHAIESQPEEVRRAICTRLGEEEDEEGGQGEDEQG